MSATSRILRILSGDVQARRSACAFAPRSSSPTCATSPASTAHLSEEAATALVNEYYDCIVPPIDERGGEVLKFMGDGILAIFRAGERRRHRGLLARLRRGPRRSAQGRAAQRHHQQRGPFRRSGIALHFGNAAYRQCRLRRAARLHRDRPRRESRLAHRRSLRPARPRACCCPLRSRAACRSRSSKTVGSFPLKGVESAADRVCAGRARARSRDMIAAGTWQLRDRSGSSKATRRCSAKSISWSGSRACATRRCCCPTRSIISRAMSMPSSPMTTPAPTRRWRSCARIPRWR